MKMAFNLGRLLSNRAPILLSKHGQHFYQNALITTTANNFVKLKVVQPSNLDKLSYEEKNSMLQLAQSPHLSIYKFQLTMSLSISHRIRGMVLSGLATALCFSAVMPPNDISYWIEAARSLEMSNSTLAFIKFNTALPATYHTLNGVRHLLWDNAKFLTIKDVYKTGYTVRSICPCSGCNLKSDG